MSTIIGIDPGTSCGWAIFRQGNIVACGAWDLAPRRHEGAGMRWLRLDRHLDALCPEDGTGWIIAYEEVRRHLGTSAAHIYGGIVATVQAWCEREAVPYLAVHFGTVKKLATGKGNADKGSMLTAARDRWPGVVWPTRQPECVDAADACWIAAAAAKELREDEP